MFKVTLKTNGQDYTSIGETIIKALEGLTIDFTEIKTKGTIVVESEGKQAEKFFYLPQLRRILQSPAMRKAWAPKLEFLLEHA